jgi:hypothetical protein
MKNKFILLFPGKRCGRGDKRGPEASPLLRGPARGGAEGHRGGVRGRDRQLPKVRGQVRQGHPQGSQGLCGGSQETNHRDRGRSGEYGVKGQGEGSRVTEIVADLVSAAL